MKLLRSIIISFSVACAAFASTLYVSCTKESCAIVCANGGVCNGAVCICATGYEGSNCQIASRQKFLGSWTIHETGTISNPAEFPVSIDTIHADTITRIRIMNFYNKYPTPVFAYVSNGTSLSIPTQIMPNSDTVSGWGTYATSSTCPTGKIFLYFKIGSTSGVDNFGDSTGSPAILGCY